MVAILCRRRFVYNLPNNNRFISNPSLRQDGVSWRNHFMLLDAQQLRTKPKSKRSPALERNDDLKQAPLSPNSVFT